MINNNNKFEKIRKDVIEKIAGDNETMQCQLKKTFDLINNKAIDQERAHYTDDKNESVSYIEHIYDTVKLYTFYMDAEIKEVVMAIALPLQVFNFKELNTDLFDFEKDFGKSFCNKFKALFEEFNKLNKVLDNQKGVEYQIKVKQRVEYIDNLVSHFIIERKANELARTVVNYAPECEDKLREVIEFTIKAHKGVTRKSGEPYVLHPISVAQILADENFEPDIIYAGVLHDVAEDTEFSLSDIGNLTNRKVMNLVDAVTQISDEEKFLDESKDEVDQRTFEKLCQMVNDGKDNYMKQALYVKAADRIHNLRTLSCFPEEKQRQKVDETEKWYLLLFKKYGVKKFSDDIEDLCFKIYNESFYYSIKDAYESILDSNDEELSTLDKVLRKVINHDTPINISENFGAALNYNIEIVKSEYTMKQLYDVVELANSELNYQKIERYITKEYINMYDYFIILEGMGGKENLKTFVNSFVKAHNQKLDFAENGMIIKNISFDIEKQYCTVIVEDKYRNTVRCMFFMRHDYNNYINGYDSGIVGKEIIGEDDLVEQIVVYTRKLEERQLPIGSTVVDFAFKIHSDLGETIYAAKVNDKDANVLTRLHNGDKVEVFAYKQPGESDKVIHVSEDDMITMKINWLNYVKTNAAKRKITKYFENILNNL